MIPEEPTDLVEESEDDWEDEYAHYEDELAPAPVPYKPRRAVPKASQSAIVAALAEAVGLEGGFATTYKPSRHEAEWLLSSLRSFYDQSLITDVQAIVKGGKEASVYRCAAHPSTGHEWLAAKVYRPQKFRSLRNDKVYREGRVVLTDQGRPVKATDTRLMRALGKKTEFGQQVAHTSWLMYEFTTLARLHEAGGAVPVPVAAAENALLMGYCGDGEMAAPPLSDIDLEPDEAPALFDEVMRNVEMLLRCGLIHGDLSAYNVLYWEGAVTLIDFPQVVSSQGNPNARALLHRDVTRVCQYFARQGVPSDPDRLTATLWSRYVASHD